MGPGGLATPEAGGRGCLRAGAPPTSRPRAEAPPGESVPQRSGLPLEGCEREGCRWRVVSGSYEEVSNRRAARHVPLAGAPHAVAERASAPLAPSTRSPTACGVPAERDPIGEHAVPTPRVELTRAHRALLPRSLPAPQQAQVPAAHLKPYDARWSSSCAARVISRARRGPRGGRAAGGAMKTARRIRHLYIYTLLPRQIPDDLLRHGRA